jgi:two-component system response regulator AgrA
LPLYFPSKKSGDSIIKFDVDNIMYFETSNNDHRIYIQTYYKKYEIYGCLSNKLALGDNFFDCHKSNIVNINNIKSINKFTRQAIMKDDSRCLISRSKLKELMDIFEARQDLV